MEGKSDLACDLDDANVLLLFILQYEKRMEENIVSYSVTECHPGGGVGK